MRTSLQRCLRRLARVKEIDRDNLRVERVAQSLQPALRCQRELAIFAARLQDHSDLTGDVRRFIDIDFNESQSPSLAIQSGKLKPCLKRHLLFDRQRAGGLEREPEGMPQYRVAIDGLKGTAPDWGFADKSVLFQQCVDCHMSSRNDRLGVASIPSIIHSGGFDSGAQMGVVHPLTPAESGLTGQRVAKYKSRHESFRRLLEHLGD